jgi:hypothetical protein
MEIFLSCPHLHDGILPTTNLHLPENGRQFLSDFERSPPAIRFSNQASPRSASSVVVWLIKCSITGKACRVHWSSCGPTSRLRAISSCQIFQAALSGMLGHKVSLFYPSEGYVDLYESRNPDAFRDRTTTLVSR